MTDFYLLDPRFLHHFPEATVLTLLDAALQATPLTLRTEHPLVDDIPFDPHHEIPASLLTAKLIIDRCHELRDLLALYSAAVQRAVGATFETDDDDDPF